MELPNLNPSSQGKWQVEIQHPGGLGDILQVADGGSWLRGVIEHCEPDEQNANFVAVV